MAGDHLARFLLLINLVIFFLLVKFFTPLLIFLESG
jgi:hypothetical protein